MISFKSNYAPKTSPLNTTTLGVRALAYAFEGDKIQSTAQAKPSTIQDQPIFLLFQLVIRLLPPPLVAMGMNGRTGVLVLLLLPRTLWSWCLVLDIALLPYDDCSRLTGPVS